MRQEWKKVRIGDLGRVVTGRTPPSSHPEYFGDEYPFITPGDMHVNKEVWNTTRYVSNAGAGFLKRIRLPARTVCVSCIGWQMGNVVMTTTDSFTNQQLNSVITNEKVVPDFLYYALKPRKQELLSLGSAIGVRTPILKKSAFEDLLVDLPPIDEQKRIVNILSAYDGLLDNNLRRIKTLEEMTRNIYREWFVKFRIPGHRKDRMVGSRLGRKPEGWEIVSLGDLVNIRKGKNITKKTIVKGSVPVVAGGIDPAYYHNVSNTQSPVITISASGANAGFVNLYYEDVWASDCSVIDSKVTKHVFYFYLLLKERQYEVTRLQRGAAQPHVYPKDLMALETNAVPEDLLDKFGQHLAPIYQMIENLKSRNKNLSQTRDFLLPRFISGELDISELSIDGMQEDART